MKNEEFKIEEITCRGMSNFDIAEMVANNWVKYTNVDFKTMFTISLTTLTLKDKQLKDYLNGAIEIAEKENCTILVNMFNEMIKDLGL